MLKFFKPNWLVIEVYHERYTFETHCTYCRHKTLKEIEEDFLLEDYEKDSFGNYIYDESGDRGEGTYTTYDTYLDRPIKLNSYMVNYTIVMPAKNIKDENWFITAQTHNKFGLFDREFIKTSTDE